MFDFLDSDWFVISLEIAFLLFIAYDARRYIKTKKREYLLNIVLTIGFAIWTLYPFYKKYYTWEEKDRSEMIQACTNEHNASYCACIDDRIFKEYTVADFRTVDQKNDKDFLEFLEESEKECREE